MNQQTELIQQLKIILESLLKTYQELLTHVRKEKEILIQANLEHIQQSNKEKESLLFKIKALDSQRQKIAQSLGRDLINEENPRLLQLIPKFSEPISSDIRGIHLQLNLCLEQLQECNRENEEHTRSALNHLSGALSEIKETLSGKSTYQRKGRMQKGPSPAGNIVRREA